MHTKKGWPKKKNIQPPTLSSMYIFLILNQFSEANQH